MKTTTQKANAPKNGGVDVDQAGGLGSANEAAFTDEKFTTEEAILSDKSTDTEVQLRKVLALLRQGPKTTVDLRRNAIMMPAARVHQLRHERHYTIRTERITLHDPEGVRHEKCARYHLVEGG
jgi:hypothetical protein